MNYHTFENWLVSNGESWEKYVCGDLGYKIKMHRRYAMYLDAVEIKKDRLAGKLNQSKNKKLYKRSVAHVSKN